MSCLDDNQVTELLEGRIPDGARTTIDAHLDDCDACRALLAAACPTSEWPSPRPGTRIARYEVLSTVGAGGMGVVYAARDPELDRRVAIKILRPRDHADTEALHARLQREAQAMARLTHPNVVAVHDVGTIDGQVFIVMELVEGGTLRDWLAAHARSTDEVLAVLRRAGEGLAAAHEVGLVHRDFKPDNVLIADDGRVLVTDFGLARSMEAPPPDSMPVEPPPSPVGATKGEPALTRAGAVLGTPAYMAPEQLDGREVDARSDVFSFCAALYEALYHARPFAGDSLGELRAAIARGELRAPPERTPAWLWRLIARGLHADPSARFPSLRALLDALGRDPAVARRRWTIATALVLAIAGAGLVVGRALAHRAQLCHGAERRLAGVWDVERKRAVREAMLATGAPAAAETFALVAGALDRYRNDWIDARTVACEATRVAREQTEDVLELRTSCLDRRLDELRELTALYSAADRPLMDNAARGAYSLARVSECADVAQLRAPIPPPKSGEARARVDEARHALARVSSLRDAGRYADADRIAAEVVKTADATDYAPLRAEALVGRAELLDKLGRFADAADALRAGFRAATAGHATRLAARARIELVWVVGHQLGKSDAGAEYADDATALLAGLGTDSELEGRLHSTRGTLLGDRGKHAEAAEEARASVRKYEAAFGPVHPMVASAIANLAVDLGMQQKLEEALINNRRALDIFAKTIGVNHPLYASQLLNQSDLLRSLGRLDEARAAIEQAQRILVASLGPQHPKVASAENALGIVETKARHYAEARRHFERALTLVEQQRGPDHPLNAIYSSGLAEACAGLADWSCAIAAAQRMVAVVDKRDDLEARMLDHKQLGELLFKSGRATEALPELESALAMAEHGAGIPQDLADARFHVAEARVKRDRGGAIRLARAALEGYRVLGAPAADSRLATEAWLRAHP